MDGKRTYQIVINGVNESIEAVASLNRQLDGLSEKISNLENKKISITSSINTTSSVSDGKKSKASSSLSEDEKLLKNIQNTEAKIQAYSKNIYQNYLASKEVLKKTLDDQKEISAQERLQADTYTNTLNGLKQKLADIKQVMQTTEIGSDMFKKYQTEANGLTTKLKDLEAKMGVFGRNVGNYQSAAEGFNKIKVAVGNTTREFANYRQAMKELMQERFQLSQSLGQESEQYKEVDLAIRQLESDYKDLNKSSKLMDSMLDTMETFTAMASIGTGISQLFGLDNSSLDEAIKKLGALFLVLKSIETLNKQWKSNDSPILNFFKSWDEKLDDFANRKSRKAAQDFLKNFGDELRNSASKAFDLMDDDILLEELKTIRDQQGKGDTKIDGKSLDEYWKSLDEEQKKVFYTNEKLSDAMQANMKNASKSAMVFKNALVVVRRALMALTSIGIGLVITELISKIGDFVKTLNTAKIKGEELNQELKALNKTLETQRDILGSQYLKGEISDEEYLKGIYDAQNNALVKQIELIKELGAANAKEADSYKYGIIPSSSENLEFTGQKINYPTTLGYGNLSKGLSIFNSKDLEITVQNIKEVETAWKNCQEAIKNGQDYLSANGSGLGDWFSSLFATVKDTEEVMRGLGNVKLSDFVAQFEEVANKFKNGSISADEYATELAKLKNQMNDNQVLNSVIANLDKYIPDEKVREHVQNIINEIVRLDDAFNMTSPQQVHYWNQVRIDGMKEGMKKTMATIEENERWEIQQYGKTEEQISLIRQKYQRQRENARKAAASKYQKNIKADSKKLADLEDELILMRLNNLKAGLDKQLQLLENERRVELKKKKEQLKELGLLEESGSTFEHEINIKYDKLILDEKRKWAFDMLKIYEDLAKSIQDVNKGTFDIEVSTANQSVNQKTEEKKTEVGKNLLTPSRYDNPKMLEKYYMEVIKIEEDAAKRQESIRQEELDKQLEYNKKAEEQRHERLVNLDGGEYIEQLRAGKITQEQYNKLIEDENDAHYAKMRAYDKQYESDSKQIAVDTNSAIQKAYSDGYDKVIGNIKSEKSKIDKVLAQQPVIDNSWGVINISKTSENYKTALKEYDNLKKQIINKQKALKTELDNGKITPEDFAIKQADLKAETQAIDESTQEIVERQKDLVGQFVQSFQGYLQSVVGSFSQIMQAVWDAQDREFEHEQEELEKLNEELETALDKQQEIVQSHKDAINDIEDELSTARGDRRSELIERLNAEVAAQKKAAKEEERIKKEQEKAQAKQDALQKKREEAEYNRQILQAIVNGAMAVTMAAVNKWPVPAIPMMALAASTTAAQLAIMKQNRYAKGGLLEGRSHAEGGIPVGNTGIEVEGKEYIIRKKSTTPNLDVLDYINKSERKLRLDDFIDFYTSKNSNVRKVIASVSPKAKFADGGIIPTVANVEAFDNRLLDAFERYSERPSYVSVVDINSRQAEVRNIQVMAGLETD